MSEVVKSRTDTRTAIVEAATALLHEGGPGAVTTRGVAERAGVQAPAIYRLFGDKDGLLEAVAEHVLATFVAGKAAGMAAATASDVDPLDDLRASWHRQIDFGLANPAVFRLLSDPERVRGSAAARMGREILETRVHRLAAAGRLRVPEPHAVAMIQAAGAGTTQMLLATPAEHRDAGLGDSMLDAVLARILTDAPAATPDGPRTSAVALRAVAPRLEALTPSERHLLIEWLDRITETPA
ncbi:TetR family transcriptional regulator [Actinoplanes philippinensis]|uniref:DNA-binding transcriptional regulator, AcrR family n=1 Tax=Actinoplanes philippinensis TaxID=35752 RepID=A0A1I2L5Q5_9ACTN|nr:TetR/AcrR family transcriptional regulator [Actinoplanes philippinensis]GIE82428.1 TetR family transcriptional regulator [Actinoplanes philippinensis]SFF74652.1 DNA-binding transcriptional regulator, AcrR family [Actinoplanes philippinensis]